MSLKIRIALQIPHPDPNKNERFFSLNLKQGLTNEMSVSKRSRGTFVISDIGGDFRNFCRILVRGRIIDRALNWIFEDGHLVILGNCLDSNRDVLECLWLIYALEEKAKKEEGHVHFIWGDKELKGINGDWRFRHPKYAKLPDQDKRTTAALYDGSNELWRWLKTKNLMERIGSILFVHGSVSMKVLYSGLHIEDINNLTREKINNPKKFLRPPVIGDLFSNTTDSLGNLSFKEDKYKVDTILRHFKVKTIVTGYKTANNVGIFFNGKVVNVHVDHTNEHSEGLLIKGHHFFRISNIGKAEKIF
jgi:hypothetical protein